MIILSAAAALSKPDEREANLAGLVTVLSSVQLKSSSMRVYVLS
jgi:hypothetical protein